MKKKNRSEADCCGTICGVNLRTAHWVIGSVHLLQALLVLVISKTFLFGNSDSNSANIGATFQSAPNVLGALASLHADSGLLTTGSSGVLQWTHPNEFDFGTSTNFTALTDDFTGCDSADVLSRSVVFLTPSSDTYNYFCAITYPLLAVASFFVVTALGAHRRAKEGSLAKSCRSGAASWFLLAIALFTAAAAPLTLFVDMFSSPDAGLGKTPLISTYGFVLVCATSLVLGHVLWSFRSHTYTTLQYLCVIVWCGGCGVTAVSPFWIKAEGPWEIFLFVIIGVHFLMAFLTLLANPSSVSPASSLPKAGTVHPPDVTSKFTRTFFSGLLVACLLGVHVVYGYEVLQAGLRSPALWRFTPDETASSIYATERLSIPKVCCQRYGVGSGATPRPGLLIGCVVAAWDKASDFVQLQEVSSQPALSVGEKYSATGLIQLCSVFFFITAFSHLFSGLRANERTPGLSPPRWAEYSVTASLMTFTIVVMGPLLNSDDVTAAVLLTVAIMCCGFLVEFALTFWLFEGNLTNGRDSAPLLSNQAPKSAAKRVLQEYASWPEVTIFGWVLFGVLWSVIISGFNQALTDATTGDATRTVPGFVSAIVATMALLFSVFGIIQLVHIIRFTVGYGKEVSRSDNSKNERLAKAVGIELAYLLASALTKTTLVWLVIGGTIRNN